MKQEQFEKIIEAQLEMIRNVLLAKQKEYATEDRLHNFRITAGLRGCTMEQALGGMLSKHTVSIYDMIESGKEYPSAQWDEKINDHIVYLLLLKAILEERRSESVNATKSQHEDSDTIYENPTCGSTMEMKKLIEELTEEAIYGTSRER